MSFHDLIWDMGGTLIDTYPPVDATLHRVVTEAGHQLELSEVVTLTRNSISSAITELSRRFGVDQDRLDEAYAGLKQRWETDPPPVMRGALEVVEAVRAQGGLNLVVTHRDRASASALLQATGLPIDDMICAPDGYRRKPDPEMYRLIVERNGLDPARCLSVGDRTIDGDAAAAAGIAGALLETPGVPAEAHDCLQIHALTDLLTHLEQAPR